jgi:hypothetical protein
MNEKTVEKQLSDEDQARVDKVISSGVNDIERQPFRPWRLLLIIWLVLLAMGGVSWLIGSDAGLI